MAKDFSPSPPPLTPPLNEEVKLDWLRLLRSRRVGVTTFFRLMQDHESAAAALDALHRIAREAGVADYETFPAALARREYEGGRRAGARLIAFGEADYPTRLTEIDEAPPLLWALGDAALGARPAVALVGARNASSLGLRMARKLATDLAAAGQVIVSGLARGIDTEAHKAGLTSGTIAVMAGGVDVIYPAENKDLARKIAETGLILSEQPMGLVAQARHFPRRNRIVSGLARAVVVVEAAAKSGSLITARGALDQGREVLAVPGHPFDARASGCNMLIRDGATLVRGASDVLEALDLPGPAMQRAPRVPDAPPARRGLTETSTLHGEILARLGPSPIAEDQLIRDLDLPAGQVTPELVMLELDGRIGRDAGGMLTRTR